VSSLGRRKPTFPAIVSAAGFRCLESYIASGVSGLHAPQFWWSAQRLYGRLVLLWPRWVSCDIWSRRPRPN